MSLLEHWYVGCTSAQLSDRPHAARIAEERIVLFRDREGVARALKDRCCHRGFPLSKGTLCEGRIACGFHGWEFEGDGRCARIPSLPPGKAIPPGYRVDSYACLERDGYVWVWAGRGEPGAVPEIPGFARRRWMQGTKEVKCDFRRALEITFDGAHVYIVHPNHPAAVAGRRGMEAHTSVLELTEQGCRMRIPLAHSPDAPVGGMEFSLPGRIRFEWPIAEGSNEMYFHIVPTGPGECRMEWLIEHGDPSAPPVRLWEGPSEIMDQDAAVLEAIQPAYEHEGDGFEKSVESDMPPLMLRRILKLAEEGKWHGLQTDLPKRRTVTMMGAKYA